MQVRDAMIGRDSLIISSPSDSVKDAMEKMVENNVGSVIITRTEDKAVGIVTTQDIINELLRSGNAGFQTQLNVIMSIKLVTIDEFDPLNHAIQKLQESSTHHIIVTTLKDKLAGILSSFDIVRERSLDIKSYPWIRKQ
ncbi:MAG: CBS domain-containing protein [Candidatus Kariarchaeaceae archaeon]|jgi:CBS domain-containing protein